MSDSHKENENKKSPSITQSYNIEDEKKLEMEVESNKFYSYRYTYIPQNPMEVRTEFTVTDDYKYEAFRPYCYQRFVDKKNFWTYVPRYIAFFFSYNPYTIEEKFKAMDLLVGLIKNKQLNGDVKLPSKYAEMNDKEFERILGALDNGKLSEAVNQYLQQKDSVFHGVRNSAVLIQNLRSLRPSETPAPSPTRAKDE